MHKEGFLKRMKDFIIKRRLMLVGGAIVILIILGLFLRNSNSGALETTLPTKGDLNQIVKVTGPVTPTSEASLSFEKTGTVSYVNVKIGDKVVAGQILAALSGDDSYAQVLQAKATLANQQAVLEQLNQGPRPEELAIKTQAVDNAKSSLAIVYGSIPDSIRDADSKVGDAIRTKLASLFTVNGTRYSLSFASCDQTKQSQIETARGSFEDSYALFQKNTAGISMISEEVALDTALENAYTTTLSATALLDSLTTLLSLSCSSSNTSLDTYRSTVSAARASITTIFTDLSSKRTALINAKNTLSQATRDLDLTKAGSDKAKVRAQEALVAQAEAQVASALAQSAKNVLVAPFNGVITNVDVVRGETASASKNAVTVISSNAYQVEAKIPEIDIAKVAVGNAVKITLDAYGDSVVFDAVVTRIDPSATLSGNVPMYRVIVSFKEIDTRIRAGMTANVSIVTASKVDVLSLPPRFVSVLANGEGSVVVVGNEKKEETRKVTLGVRGDNGYIEIVTGLQEDEKVKVLATGVRAAQKENTGN